MIQMINKLKKNQKGFTLVELIVVLVILAILAAFTIPAMLGFVDDARGKAAIAQGREIYVAAQSAGTDVAAGSNGKLTTSEAKNDTTDDNSAKKIYDKVKVLIGSDISGSLSDSIVRVNDNVTFVDTSNPPANNAYITVSTTGSVLYVKFVDSTGKYAVKITPNASGTSAEVNKIK